MRLATVTVVVCSMTAVAYTGSTAAQEQRKTFKVLVLDALDGKPQSNVSVTYFCEGQGYKPDQEIKTGIDGSAEIPYQCEAGTRIEISVIPPENSKPAKTKEECGSVQAMTIEQILATGLISEPTGAGNIWCPNKQRSKLKAMPGQITVFVKKPTWWQRHVAG